MAGGPPKVRTRRRYHWLAVLPAVGMLGGIPFVNRVHPMIFGLPLLFAWLVAWVLATSAVMGGILLLDRSHDAAVGADEASSDSGETR